jgi:hypothetical protein
MRALIEGGECAAMIIDNHSASADAAGLQKFRTCPKEWSVQTGQVE